MEMGALKKVNKLERVSKTNEIELSMNSFINRDKYFGLISFEPEP